MEDLRVSAAAGAQHLQSAGQLRRLSRGAAVRYHGWLSEFERQTGREARVVQLTEAYLCALDETASKVPSWATVRSRRLASG